MKFRNYITVLAACFLACAFGSIARASSVCTTTTYAALEASGGCTIGDLSFTNFALNVTVDANALIVTPTTNGLIFEGPTVDFHGGFFIGTAMVTATDPNSFINSVNVAIAAGLDGSKQSFCIGAGNNFSGNYNPSNCTNPSSTAFLTEGLGNPALANASFDPVKSITEATIYVDSTLSSTSFLTWTVGEVTIAPEPGTVASMLTGLGIVTFAYFRRKRLNPQS